jgi:hypothetical protein
MHPANIPEQLRARCHCPCCGDLLSSGPTADPWAICLACRRDHRFFIMPETPHAVDTAKASEAELTEIRNLSLSAIASFWLSEPGPRSILNQQLAQLLRVTLESRSVLDEPRLTFCAICGDVLGDWDQPDIYVQGLRCSNGHCWTSRGGRLTSLVDGMCLTLQAEYADATVSKLIASWLKGSPYLDTNLHESIRRVLMSSPLCPRDALGRSD